MKKIVLARHQEKYCEEIYRLSSMPQVKEALGLPEGTIEDTKRFTERVMAEEKLGKTLPRVILNEEGRLVGLTDLMFVDHEKESCHIGTWIGHEYWGQGYNAASKLAILRVAFEELGLARVFAGARRVNLRSQRAQEKLPFIRLHVEEEFPEEHTALEEKEKQPCVLNVFCKEDYFRYMSENQELVSSHNGI